MSLVLLTVGFTMYGMEKSNNEDFFDTVTEQQEPSEKFSKKIFEKKPIIRKGILGELDGLCQLLLRVPFTYHQVKKPLWKVEKIMEQVACLQEENKSLKEKLEQQYVKPGLKPNKYYNL